jgi:hypothetical protein
MSIPRLTARRIPLLLCVPLAVLATGCVRSEFPPFPDPGGWVWPDGHSNPRGTFRMPIQGYPIIHAGPSAARGGVAVARAKCVYRVHLPAAGGGVARTVASVRLTVGGPAGGSYAAACSNLMLVELPDDAAGVAATATAPDGTVTSVPDATVASLATGPHAQLTAEPGTKLVLVGPIPPSQSLDVELSFTLGSLRDITVKPVLLGQADCNGTTYRPPLVPAVTSMASAPGIVLPVSETPVAPDLSAFGGPASVSVTCE